MFALARLLRIPRAAEVYGLSILYLVLTAYFLAQVMPWWAAVPLAPIVIQVPMYIVGLFVMPLWRNNLTVHSRMMMALLLGASVYFRMWPMLILAAANALAWRFLLGFAVLAPLTLFIDWRVGIGVVVLSHLLIVYATLAPNCQWLGPVITCFETDRKEVWLTIDDGPASDTEAIREMLARRNARATFFEIGRNHSMTHPSATFWCLGPRRLAREIGNERWFRAPVGMKNPFVHPILAKRGMRLIGWTVRGLDSSSVGVSPAGKAASAPPTPAPGRRLFGRRDANTTIRRIMRGVRPGAIVVLHQGRPHSLQTIESVVDALQREGYELVIPDDARLKTKR